MKNIKKTIFTSALVLSTLAVTGVGVFATQKPSTANKIAETKTLKNGTDTVSNSKASPKITSSKTTKTTKRANSNNSANSQSNNSNSSASSSANESAKTIIPSSNSTSTHSQKLATSSASNSVSASSASSVSSASSANAVVASSAKPVALAITEQSETNVQTIGSADTLYPTSPLYSAEASSASAADALYNSSASSMESASNSSSSTTSSSSVSASDSSANVSSATSDYSSSSASSASAATSTLSFSNPITKVISYDFNGSKVYRTIELPADTKTVNVYEWSDKGTWSRFIEKNVPISAFVSSYPTFLISSDADGFEIGADTSAGIHYEYVLKVAFD